MLQKTNNGAVYEDSAPEKIFFEASRGFENARKFPAPQNMTAPTVEALAYWGELIKRKAREDNTSFDLALSRASAIVLKMGRVNDHDEYFSTTQKTGKRHYINIKTLEHCYTAYSPCVSVAAVYDDNGAVVRADLDGKRCCKNDKLCPYDAKKAAMRNAEKTSKIVQYAITRGYNAVMITLTAPHTAKTNEADFVVAIGDCLRRVVKSSPFDTLRSKYGITDLGVVHALPYVRGYEAMLGGPNGAHDHYHLLLWYDGGKRALKEIIAVFRAQWIAYVEAAGLVPTEKRAYFEAIGFKASPVKRREQQKAVDYVTKLNAWKGKAKEWSEIAEVTRSDLKKTRGSSLTPFQLLAKICMMDAPAFLRARKKADKAAIYAEMMADIDTYCRYAGATRRRRLVDYSNGLGTWADAMTEDAPKETKETLFGFHGADFAFLVNYGIISTVKKAVLNGSETTAAVLNLLEDKGFELWTPAQIADLRVNEERKRAEIREDRRQTSLLRSDLAAAARDGSISLTRARVTLSDWAFGEFLRLRAALASPLPDNDILLLQAPPLQTGLFDHAREVASAVASG